MTQQVTPMPGTGCAYFARGRCFRRMQKDPSLHEQWRCRIVAKWEDAFDAYLDQVDQFEISQETAMAIWSRRLGKMIGPGGCPDFTPGADPVLGCAHLHFDLCTGKLPPCPGRCRHYTIE